MKSKASCPSKIGSSSPRAPVAPVHVLAKHFSTCLTSHVSSPLTFVGQLTRVKLNICISSKVTAQNQTMQRSLWGLSLNDLMVLIELQSLLLTCMHASTRIHIPLQENPCEINILSQQTKTIVSLSLASPMQQEHPWDLLCSPGGNGVPRPQRVTGEKGAPGMV